jgi:hypothetical protein
MIKYDIEENQNVNYNLNCKLQNENDNYNIPLIVKVDQTLYNEQLGNCRR